MAKPSDRYLFFPWSCLEIEGSDGNLIRVGGLPLLARCEFQWRLDVLLEIVQSVDSGTKPHELFDKNPKFKSNMLRCLELFRIPPNNISFYQAWVLLFGDGNERGMLVQLEFPEKEKPDPEPGDGVEFDEHISPEARLMASLWSHTGDPEKAIALAQSYDIPGEQLLDVLSARNAIAKANAPKDTSKKGALARAKQHFLKAKKKNPDQQKQFMALAARTNLQPKPKT